MKITINDKQIELTPTQEATIKEALGIKEKKGLWRPKNDDKYWLLDYDGSVVWSNWNEDYHPNKSRWEIGNVFPTKEVAEKHRDKLKAIQRVKEYIAENCEEFTPDWNNKQQYKFTIFYYHVDKKFIDDCGYSRAQGYWPFQYLASEEDAQKVIDNCEADLKVIFDITS